jgi:hypothetical protein
MIFGSNDILGVLNFFIRIINNREVPQQPTARQAARIFFLSTHPPQSAVRSSKQQEAPEHITRSAASTPFFILLHSQLEKLYPNSALKE